MGRDSEKTSFVLSCRRASYKISLFNSCITPLLNDNFNRITKVKATNNSSVTTPVDEFRKIEAAMTGSQEAQSFSFWHVSMLWSYVRNCGFMPPGEALYNRLSNSLSLSLVDQAKASFALSTCMNLTRRAHFPKFAQRTITGCQKCCLMATSPFLDRLFDKATLKEVVQEYKGADATTFHFDLSKAVAKGLLNFGKRNHEETKASPGLPLVPHAVPSTSKAAVGSMFASRYGGRGRGQRRGGIDGQCSGKSAPALQKPACRIFQSRSHPLVQ